ncbi:MAG TPA: SDR family NAD(P)-dependent oxidoreductase [Actinomycetota bacterium]|nr:SDR family NAD(P)-dependent oxidoreductase [Actinomycetota bacterium]
MEISPQTVAVVTGGSSGIGRETVLAFLREGASVVTGARASEALAKLQTEHGASGRLVTVEGDVADSYTADRLVAAAVARFGRLDVWVNNAAVMSFGSFLETPEDAWRRIIEVNLLGYANGARAALAQFKRQGYGILVNVSSVLGKTSAPDMSAYVASKFGIQGLGEVLRTELLDEPNIAVCHVLPGGVNTALYRHCANFAGRNLRPMYPLQNADAVAKAILKSVRRPRRERWCGRTGRLQIIGHYVSPPLYERLVGLLFPRIIFGRAEVPRTSGNLFEPAGGPRPAMKPRERVVWKADSVAEEERVSQSH